MRLAIGDGQQRVLRPCDSKLAPACPSPRERKPNTYRAGGVDAHEFHFRIFPWLREFGSYISCLEIVLFEKSSQDCVHTVKREWRGTSQTLGQLLNNGQFRCASRKSDPTFAGVLELRWGVLRVPPPRRRLDRGSWLLANMRMSVLGGFEEARKAESSIYFCRVGRERVTVSTFLTSTTGASLGSGI